ncbi:ABC-2 transporter permease [Desulforamulus aquiferis]|uniref:ABC-2 transporter permease n=1 Tax=Desulforamulus aquiferis TaxID=1397668 RepID=A0AAW7ZBB6_9FIRM|nr:ABC-2 transporter permease [Desulforamulus aquiferis]MDO7786637.1 ABC-2 transporter permease [Desulforamulus aquiferis]
MYYLILKDLLIQKKIIALSIAYVIFFIIAMQGTGFVMYATAITALTYMLVMTSCAYDEKNRSDLMLNSLPLKRTSIVIAKYISIFVYVVMGTIAYVLTTTVIYLTGLPIKYSPVSLEGFIGGLLSICIINCIYLPCFFKFGYQKSRILNFLLFFSFFFGITSVVNYLFVNREAAWAQGIKSYFQTYTDGQILILVIGLIICMLTASLILSIKIYKNKDL